MPDIIKNVIIRVKGGLEENIGSLTLQHRELALTTDTFKLFAGDVDGTPIAINPDIVEIAKKLETPRNIALTGDIAGNVNFDGSGDVSIVTTLSDTGVVAGTYDVVVVGTDGRITSGITLTYSPNVVMGTDGNGKPVSIDEVSVDELKQLAGIDTTQTIQGQLDDITDSLDNYIKIEKLPNAVSEVVLEQTASTASLTVTTVDTETGTTVPATTNFNIASAAQTGLMPKEAYSQLQKAAEDIEGLKGSSKRYVVDLEGNVEPTQAELLSAYETASGATGNPEVDGVTLFDLTSGLEYQWFETLGEWVRKGSAVIGLATQEAAGIVKGDEDTDGKVFVESDGTMSVIGWDGKANKDITVAGKPLSSDVVLESLTIKDDTEIIGVYNPSTAATIDIAPTIESYLEDYALDVADALSGKVDKVLTSVSDNLAVFTTGGNVADSGIAMGDVLLAGMVLDGGSF